MSVIARTIQCTTCRGSGEMESDDSTDDCIYKCWACDGTGKIADRRRPDPQLAGAVALLEEVRKRSGRPFGGHAPYDLAARIERFLDDGVYEPHPATLDDGGR